jgi:hypothetical protein
MVAARAWPHDEPRNFPPNHSRHPRGTITRADGRSVGHVEPDTEEVKLEADGRVLTVKLQPNADDQKVGSCTPGPQAGVDRFDVFTASHRGCTKNEGFMTAQTKKLVVDGDVTWTFASSMN